MGKGSAAECKPRVKELRIGVHVGHFVTITLNARIYLTLEITLQNITLRLRLSHESNNLQNVSGADVTIGKLDGIEVNNHVGIFGGELHCGEISQHGQDTGSGWVWRNQWTAV